MSHKATIITAIAGLPDDDSRLDKVGAVLNGQTKPEHPDSLKLLRMGEAARLSGLSRCTLWRLCKEGRLRTVQIRKGSLRIPEDELRRLAQGRMGDAS